MVILTLVNTKMSSLALLRLNNEVMKIIGALDQLLVFSLCRYSVDALKVVSHILRDCAILHTSYKFNCIKSSGCFEFRLYHSNFTFVCLFYPRMTRSSKVFLLTRVNLRARCVDSLPTVFFPVALGGAQRLVPGTHPQTRRHVCL